jgi:hypothetical protein
MITPKSKYLSFVTYLLITHQSRLFISPHLLTYYYTYD